MIIQVSGKAIFLITHGFDWLNPATIVNKIAGASVGYLSRLFLYTVIPLFSCPVCPPRLQA